jgi:osmotically-inducible protein OsmY
VFQHEEERMPAVPPNASLIARIEAQLAESGLQVTVEFSDGALILNGIVETEESRQAAEDIASSVAPDAQIDNQVDVQTILPTDIDDFVGDEPTAEMAERSPDVRGELEPDFSSRRVVTDPVEIGGPDSSGPEDVAETGETYTPPDDPVLRTDARGRPQVLGGFDSSSDDTDVDVSSDGTTGDEALADAVRRELAEDSATTDLSIVVAVRNGIAHLRGQVADLDDADNAESVAARVPGIREVVEELDVINV